jgi:WD40 repeat protein
MCKYVGHADKVRAVTIFCDDKVIGSGSMDKHFKLWNAETGSCLFTSEELGCSIHSLDVTDDSSLLATALDDGSVILWQTEIVIPPPEPPAEACETPAETEEQDTAESAEDETEDITEEPK